MKTVSGKLIARQRGDLLPDFLTQLREEVLGNSRGFYEVYL